MLFRFEIQAYNIRGKILILFSLLNLSNHAVGISVGRIPAFIGNDNFISRLLYRPGSFRHPEKKHRDSPSSSEMIVKMNPLILFQHTCHLSALFRFGILCFIPGFRLLCGSFLFSVEAAVVSADAATGVLGVSFFTRAGSCSR